MICIRNAVILAVLLASRIAAGDIEEITVEEEDFDLPGADVDLIGSDIGLDDADFIGNPLAKSKRWPEDLVVAPIPGFSPQLGWNLKLVTGYFIGERDEESNQAPSVLGGFGMIAENGSYAYGGGANLHLLDDKLRVAFGAAYADIRYRYYGQGNIVGDLGISVDIIQDGPLYFGTASWRIWKKLYAGLGVLRGNVDTRLRVERSESSFFDPTLNLDVGAYSIPLQLDTRDHEQFPVDGWLVTARGTLYRESIGSDFDAQVFKISANRYLPMRDNDTLATRVIFRTTSGNAPFFLLSTIGGSTDLRGYPSGRYRDRMMYAVQSEYRWQFNDSWIFTAFAGVGEVADDVADFGENFLPAGGIGARFVLSKKHRIGLSADIAVGSDGAEFYFGVGEAF